MIRIGEAIARCDKERGAQFANAIITQVRPLGSVQSDAIRQSDMSRNPCSEASSIPQSSSLLWWGFSHWSHPCMVLLFIPSTSCVVNKTASEHPLRVALQVDRALKSRLAGPGPGPDQMVAVMDAVGASSWQVGTLSSVLSVLYLAA